MKWLIYGLCLLAPVVGYTKQLNFATEATYPPFVSMNVDNQVQGFETDVLQQACNLMEVECIFTHQPWESLIIGVKLGKFDAVYGGMEITEARQQHVNFSQPIYENEIALLAPIAEIQTFSPEMLQGKTIGVQGGTTLEQFLNKEYDDVTKVKTYTSIRDALLDLNTGRVAGVLGDKPVLALWLIENNKDETYQLLDLPDQYSDFFGEGYGVAVNKQNDELLMQLNDALATLKENSTYQAIYQSYFN